MVRTVSIVVEQEMLLCHSAYALWCIDLPFVQNVDVVAQLMQAAPYLLANKESDAVFVHIVVFHMLQLFSCVSPVLIQGCTAVLFPQCVCSVHSSPCDKLGNWFVALHSMSRVHMTLLQG